MVEGREEKSAATKAECKNPSQSLHNENPSLLVSSVVMGTSCAHVVPTLVSRTTDTVGTTVGLGMPAAAVIWPAPATTGGRM